MDNITCKTSKQFNKKLRKKCPSLKYHSCVLKNFPVNLEIQKMLELRLLKAYQIIHRSIQSPCGLNQAVSLQLNLRTFFNSPIVGFTASHRQLGRAFILLLWEARDNSTSGVLPGVSKTAYDIGNWFLAKPELLKCPPAKKCQAFCSWCAYLSQFNTLPSDFFSSIMICIPNYKRCFSMLFHGSMYQSVSSAFLNNLYLSPRPPQ